MKKSQLSEEEIGYALAPGRWCRCCRRAINDDSTDESTARVMPSKFALTLSAPSAFDRDGELRDCRRYCRGRQRVHGDERRTEVRSGL
jgi:hypothetical protein